MAERLSLKLVERDRDSALLLVHQGGRLEIRHVGKGKPGPVYVDFVSGKAAHRRNFGGGRGQPLARAIGLKGGQSPRVIDATAGLGRDAFVLATLGCEVTMIEQSNVIAALLEDGVRRALADSSVREIAQRMHLVQGNALSRLSELPRPDVIYLDPMYPHRGKQARAKKEMQLLQRLIGLDTDSERLLKLALDRAEKRVVVKRPAKAPPVGNLQPQATVSSPNTRFDLYFCNA